jgi:endonuclease G
MAAPVFKHFDYDFDILETAVKNWARRSAQREDNKAKVATGRLAEVETPERLSANRKYRLDGRRRAVRATASLERMAPIALDSLLHERVIGNRDFLGIEFLEMAMAVARFVGRVHIRERPGVSRGFGSGLVVSPRLFLTNNHVLPDVETARHSEVEFDYQKDRFGRPLNVVICGLEPDTFFLTDRKLDFSIVAVREESLSGPPLKNYAWVRLRADSGKALVGDALNIIQHPRGEMKQLVLRSNKLVDNFEDFVHYETDTEPGSSGSPVFNDLWDVVALHHSGVPKTNQNGDFLDVDDRVWVKGRDDPERLAWVGNEGIRISSIVEFVESAQLGTSAQRDLRQDLLEKEPPHPMEVMAVSPPQEEKPIGTPTTTPTPERAPAPGPVGGSVTVTIPLQLTISLGAVLPAGASLPIITPAEVVPRPDEGQLEKVEPDPSDPEYENRPGYDPQFLGFEVPFPGLTNVTEPKAFALPSQPQNARFELKYHHFSVIFNKARRLAFAAGVNYDPTARVQFKREGKDRWFYDPRVKPEEELQAGEDLYAGNPLDRGHLVRRADAAWGRTEKEAKLANDDTFHFTNCSPQHEITNQGKVKDAPPGLKLWGKLEDHIASQGKEEKRKLNIFNGPVFRPRDTVYRGVRIPKEFWKVVVFEDDSGKEAAAAFVLTQAELIQGLEEEFDVGEYKAVQVKIRDLEAKTDLDFGPLRNWDVLEKAGAQESFEGDVPAVVLESVTDVVL